MELPTRCLLIFLTLLVLRSTTGSSPTLGAAAAATVAVVAPVRVGVVLDLRSDMGRKRRACISKALHDFNLKHPSYATRVELLVRDSRGDPATAAYAADDLINNTQVEAIIWGPKTLNKEDHLSPFGHHRNNFPVISFSSISPATCAFWLEDPVPASGGHRKFCFTLGNESIIFFDLKTDKRHNIHRRRKMQDCRGKLKLRIAVPKKEDFQVFVSSVIDPISKEQFVSGYSIDIFEAAVKNLHPRPCYKFLIFEGTYDELVGNVSLGVYDAAVGDVTITAERVNGTEFTMPYTESGVSMLVLAEDEPNTISWTFVKPLKGGLWLATIAFVFYTGLVVWVIEHRTNADFRGSTWRECSNSVYYLFSTVTFSHGGRFRSPLSKIVVVIWGFVVLILVQSYTASLSSMLTAKRLRPWVTDLEQLRHNGDFVGYQHGSFVRSFLMKHNISENRLVSYKTKEEYASALSRGSNNGGVSAIVDEIPYITLFLADRRYSNDFQMLGCIYKTPGFGFAFHRGSMKLVQNLSIAILNLAGGNEASQIEVKWFGTPSSLIGDGTVLDADSGRLTLQSFSGLFLITGSISTLMLLISIGKLVYAKCARSRRPNVESINDDCGNEDFDPLHNGMGDNHSLDQQPVCEANYTDSQGAHGRGENAGNGDPNPVQQNDRQSHSVSADLIEMTDV